ncbi:Uncharacterized protein Adt_11209 [Abeliophyllum distichum]|uniref:Uncharacterized protein n=1 Tax=Abeliophyllum distichum TaxID=126358 RepID=A0ABD1UM77_9LAMI
MDDNFWVRDPPPTDMDNIPVPMVRAVKVNEKDILMGEYMMPPIVENRSIIIYLPYGYDNFQLRPDVINLFSNNLHFYGRTDENLHFHHSHFMKYQGVNKETLRMRLFTHSKG